MSSAILSLFSKYSTSISMLNVYLLLYITDILLSSYNVKIFIDISKICSIFLISFLLIGQVIFLSFNLFSYISTTESRSYTRSGWISLAILCLAIQYSKHLVSLFYTLITAPFLFWIHFGSSIYYDPDNGLYLYKWSFMKSKWANSRSDRLQSSIIC